MDNVEADSPNKDLLELLATDFQAGGYDLKRLLRAIVLSQCYQRGAHSEAAEDVRERQRQVFARFPVRPLSVDQLYLSIAQATGHVATEEEDKEDEEGDDKSVELLVEQAPTVQRRLALMNGAYANEAIHAGVKATRVVHGPKLGAEHIEWLFLATLSRRPAADEAAKRLI